MSHVLVSVRHTCFIPLPRGLESYRIEQRECRKYSFSGVVRGSIAGAVREVFVTNGNNSSLAKLLEKLIRDCFAIGRPEELQHPRERNCRSVIPGKYGENYLKKYLSAAER